MSARHRVSKLLLAHGRVYEGATTRNKTHRVWLGRQRFEQAPAELAFIDLLAAVDGLIARKDALDERLSRLATDERLWPTVARLRAFRGIDTLTALAVHLELGGDWQRFRSPRKLFSWLGLTPSLDQSGQSNSALLGSLVSPGERERQEAEINELPAGLAAAGPALEDRLHQQHRLRECQADRGRKGFSRSSVRNPCDAVTSAVWWCHPSHERPS
jgi:hypothetical protein